MPWPAGRKGSSALTHPFRAPQLRPREASCGFPSPSTAPPVGLKTSSTPLPWNEEQSELPSAEEDNLCPQQKQTCGETICCKNVPRGYCLRSWRCICALDSFMAGQWKLLLMSNISISPNTFHPGIRSTLQRKGQIWAAAHITLSWIHVFGINVAAKALWHLLCFN